MSLYLIFFSVSSACALFSALFSFFNGKKNFSAIQGSTVKYSMKRYFPFELFEGKNKDSRAGKIGAFLYVCFAAAFSCLGFTICQIPSFQGYLSLAILLALLSFAELGLFLSLCLVPAFYFRKHLFAFVAYSALSVIRLIVMTLSAMNFGKNLEMASGLGFGFMIVFGLGAVAGSLLLANPRLANWTKMDVEMNQDGSTLTTRPKVFPLALSEWSYFILNTVSGFLYGLMLLIAAAIVLA